MNHDQLLTLRAEITTYAGLNYEAIVAALNERVASVIPNPTPQATVSIPVAMMDILEAALTHDPTNTPALIAALAPIADRFERDLAQRNERAIAFYLNVYGSALNTAAQSAIQALLVATQPDPGWSETVTVYTESRAATLGLPFVRTTDIQSALHLAEVTW